MSTFGSRQRELEPGETLGPYRLEELVGRGAMGLVFRAVREPEKDEVALKLLRLELADDETTRRRFVHEARSAAAVRHPNLVPILEAGELDGRPFLAVAFVPGPTLEARVAAEGALPVADLVRAVGEIAAALDVLHEHGLVHRDVKASNIMFGADGTALLTDFGLAKGRAYTALTQPGSVLGTLDYLAPELIRGEAATPASDLYALGCVAYEAAVGTPPFGGRSVLQVGMAHLGEEPPDPAATRADLPPALCDALLRALAKEPQRRPARAGAYAEELAAAAGSSA